MKEFQSNKQDPKDVATALNESDTSQPEVLYQHADTAATLIPQVQDQQQQQQSFFASAAPQQASNFFDNLNGSGFEIAATAPLESVPFIPVKEPMNIVQQNLVATPMMAQSFQPEQLNLAVDHNKVAELQQVLDQQNHQITQLKSELEFHRTTALNLQKNTDDLNRLRQETQSHVDVVKVLVSEKSNLMDALQKSELTVKLKTDENDELHNRLNVSRNRVKQLESDVKNSSSKPFIEHQAEQKRIDDIVAAKIKEFQDSNERIDSERNEMKVVLSQKRIELENLQKNFDHLSTELHLANVKIAQLSDGTPTDNSNQSQLNAISQEIAIKQQQITELYSIIDQVNRDKEASDNQYQNYVTHLTREMETLKESSTELSNENDSLVKREQELLKHVSDLERQIQQQMQKQKTYAEDQKEPLTNQTHEETQKLVSQMASLTELNESLKSQLSKAEAEKNELSQHFMLKHEEMKNMEMLVERLKTETPNLSQLMTDFEDKSVAASRALSQNHGLKEQLDEMQRAFITMTNDKMELTEKLQSEMHLCKEMKHRYDTMEAELNEMKEKWQYKEDEMIRLSHETTELEKKILQQNMEIDRLRHYESKEYHGTESILEKELENGKRLIEILTNKINILESNRSQQEAGHDHNHDHHDGHGHSHSHENNHDHHQHEHEHETKDHKCQDDNSKKRLIEEIEMLKMEKSELLKAMQDFQISKKSSSDGTTLEEEVATNGTDGTPEMNEELMKKLNVPKSVTPSMATEEALEKLQARFRRTMLEVAELSEEKQRLEHVVTQLQFETETIGEYITLYQYQRRLLKQKEHERDVQLKSLAADREKMNDKLVQLNGLIERFVLQHTDNVELAKEATKFLDQGKEAEPFIVHPDTRSESMMKLKQETAGKILEILSDIKTANSMTHDANVGVENCSCCLGKLETV